MLIKRQIAEIQPERERERESTLRGGAGIRLSKKGLVYRCCITTSHGWAAPGRAHYSQQAAQAGESRPWLGLARMGGRHCQHCTSPLRVTCCLDTVDTDMLLALSTQKIKPSSLGSGLSFLRTFTPKLHPPTHLTRPIQTCIQTSTQIMYSSQWRRCEPVDLISILL